MGDTDDDERIKALRAECDRLWAKSDAELAALREAIARDRRRSDLRLLGRIERCQRDIAELKRARNQK